jgi:hypothetical protein
VIDFLVRGKVLEYGAQFLVHERIVMMPQDIPVRFLVANCVAQTPKNAEHVVQISTVHLKMKEFITD